MQGLYYTKTKAFLFHFGISLIIFSTILYFVLFKWYPQPFFSTDGGWQGLRLIVFVDLVLGPLLTFIVFNPEKKKTLLKLDLSLIAIFQISALSWGVWAVHNERPYLSVFVDGTFHTLPYYQAIEADKSEKLRQITDDTDSPILLYIPMPQDKLEYLQLLMKATLTRPLHFMTELYQPFNRPNAESAARHAINMEQYLDGEDNAWRKEYMAFVSSIDSTDHIDFYGLNGRYKRYIVAFDREKMTFAGVLKIPPPRIDEIYWGKAEAKRRRARDAQRKADSTKSGK